MKHICTVIATLIALSLASPALAQSAKAKQAAKLYRTGSEEYLRGNYVDALAHFRKGYDLEPNGMFLYNISLVYGKLENYAEALNYAVLADEKDLPVDAWARNMPRVLAYRMILNSRRMIETRGQCASELDCQVGWVCNTTQMTCEPKPKAAEVEVVANATPESSSTMSWVGWSGVVLTVGGAGLLTMAVLKDASVAKQVEDYNELLERDDIATATLRRPEIEDSQAEGKLFLYTGVGLLGVGLGLLIYDLVKATESPVSMTPLISTSGSGISVFGHF